MNSNENRIDDPFFTVIYDGNWNACVGQQGDEQYYVDGYIEAATLMVSVVIDQEMMSSRDTLIMPILYNARHGMELAFKFFIKELHSAGVISNKHAMNHNIYSHWSLLNDENIGDSLIRKLLLDLEPYVQSLHNIDEDGQELRYAEDIGGQKSLDGISVVNLKLVRGSLENMARLIKEMKKRVFGFVEEIKTGSYTTECSRSDLRIIAQTLGDHATWQDDAFLHKKEEVRHRFNLSGKKFSKAVEKIRSSRELAVLVGLESPLKFLSDDKAIYALGRWCHAKDRYKREVGAFNQISAESYNRMRAHTDIVKELDGSIVESLTLDEIADLETLFYMGQPQEMGEYYENTVISTADRYRESDHARAMIHHIMAKTNLMEDVVRGCEIVGRPSLARQLLELENRSE
jgi:hypothetical protein